MDQAGHIEDTRLAEALSERYVAYALSTIMARSLPDVRDGLKPVHRRLLFAMQQLKLDPTSGFKKCARVVGDVIGKFHPHGDASVYDALVRLAQDFAARYPLVEGQGNFGSIDGDGAAAMRYTESRMTEVARVMLEGISDDAVDFRPTYDNEDQEPVVLPGFFPNLLANGAAGIAVGMATNIPPHNAAEIYRAARMLIARPETKISELLTVLPGPDFPTGGILVEDRQAVLQAYETGRGSFRTRARWNVEKAKGGVWNIIVTEIPYQVQKSKLIEQIASLMEQKKLPLLSDVRDESTTDIRLVLEPRTRQCEPELLMEMLFRTTQLESRFSLNMNVLNEERVPGVMSLKEVLNAWLAHIHTVLIRRSRHRLEAVLKRCEILDGFLLVYLNLDEVIRIVREEDEPKQALIEAFSLTELQAEYILNMRLRSLRKLEEMEIRKERTSLGKEQTSLEGLLDSEKKRWKMISGRLHELEKRFSEGPYGPRRTLVAEPPREIDTSLIMETEKEPVTVLLSREGWIRTIKGHGVDPETFRFKEGDEAGFSLECQTTDRLCLVGKQGRAYTIRVSDLPGGRGFGQAIRTLCDLAQDDIVVALFVLGDEDEKWLLASAEGRGMIIAAHNLAAEKRTGRQVFNLGDGDVILACLKSEGNHVLCLGENKKALIFPLEQVPEMNKGRGVLLQKLGDSRLKSVLVFTLDEGLLWKEGQRTRPVPDLKPYLSRRGAVGKLAPQWMLRK